MKRMPSLAGKSGAYRAVQAQLCRVHGLREAQKVAQKVSMSTKVTSRGASHEYVEASQAMSVSWTQASPRRGRGVEGLSAGRQARVENLSANPIHAKDGKAGKSS
jgi:hypothetical protein